MNESKDTCMECLTFKTGNRTFSQAINGVSQKMMMNAGHMNTNLVGTSCFQHALHMGVLPEPVQDPVMGYGILAEDTI